MQLSDFPLILSYLQSGAQRRPLENFERGLHQFTVGLELGEIPNVRWNDAKQDINRALDESWRALIDAQNIWRDRDNVPEAVQELAWASNPQLHTIASWQKRMDKFTIDHPAATAIRAFLLEAKPLGEAAEKLKTFIVKRPTKAPEEQKPRYVPPRASDGAIESIRTALESITAQAYERLRSAFVESYTKELNDYLDEQRSASTPAKIRDRKTPSIVWSCATHEWVSGGRYEFTIRPDAAEIIIKEADRDATDIRDKFIYKNLAKLASIVDAKQNFKSVDVISYDVNLAALRGSLRLKFEDGSQFDVQNSVVWSRSIYNKPFLRFPLTFHDVKMPDGSKMKQPSEEKMNTEFSGRYYGTVRAPESEKLLLESLGLRLGKYDTARGVFPAEATYEAKVHLAAFSEDFEAALLLRAFKPISDMSVDELKAELNWHEWSTASGNALDHQAHEAVVSALNTRNRKAVAQRAFSTAPSNERSPALGE